MGGKENAEPETKEDGSINSTEEEHMQYDRLAVRSRKIIFFFLMIRRPTRSTQSESSAASDVYKGQISAVIVTLSCVAVAPVLLSLIHISEPTRQAELSYAVFGWKKNNGTELPRPD